VSRLEEIGFPGADADERELLLSWLAYLRGAVIRKATGVSDEQARWTPDGALICLLGIVKHLACVEWRWIDGAMLGAPVSRSEAEFAPGPELTLAQAVADYRARAVVSDAAIRGFASITEPSRREDGADLRWILLHLINETARHAGHADAVRELIDGDTGQ
jgi:hypothetical protein